MKFKGRYWLNQYQYLAVLDGVLVIVTIDKDGKPVRWAIFGNEKEGGAHEKALLGQ